MSNIIAAKVRIKGTRLHIQHRFSVHSIPLEKQERTGVAGNDPEEWKKTCIINKKREMCVLPQMLFSMIAGKDGGGKHVKKGRGSAVKDFASTVQILEDAILLTRDGSPVVLPEEPEFVEEGTPFSDLPKGGFVLISSVVNPSTRGRNIRYRAAIAPGWTCEFTCLFDKTVISRQQMEAALQASAKLVGLSNSRSIGHGRFRIDELDFVENADSLLEVI